MAHTTTGRRNLLKSVGVGALLVACDRDQEKPVTATEDLMREHGVIRRVLIVYRESAQRLRQHDASLPFDALQRAARLIRTFGEDYHERQLEESHIFPALKQTSTAAAGQIDTLIAQHQRGRELTDQLLALNASALGTQAAGVAQLLDSFARMYEPHTAIEDTVVFPAWKQALSAKQLDEMGERFEDIEHKTFGHDGFDDAVKQIDAIERAFGFELAKFTPPQSAG